MSHHRLMCLLCRSLYVDVDAYSNAQSTASYAAPAHSQQTWQYASSSVPSASYGYSHGYSTASTYPAASQSYGHDAPYVPGHSYMLTSQAYVQPQQYQYTQSYQQPQATSSYAYTPGQSFTQALQREPCYLYRTARGCPDGDRCKLSHS